MWALSRKELRLVLLCSTAGFLVVFNSLTMNVIMNDLAEEFAVDFSTIIGVISGAFIFEIAFVLISIDVTDKIGKKRAIIAGMAAIAISSLVISFSVNIPMILLGKMIASFGTSLVFTANVSFISDIVSKDYLGEAFAVNYAFNSIGAALGPLFGLYVSELFGWRTMILLVIPLALTIMLMFRDSENIICRPGLRIDYVSHLLFIISISLILNSFLTLRDYFAVTFTIGLLSLIILIIRQRRSENKILNIKLFRSRAFLIGSIMMTVFYFVLYSIDDVVIDSLQLSGGEIIILGAAVSLTAIASGLKSIKTLVQTISSPILANRLKGIDPNKLILFCFIILLVSPVCILVSYHILTGTSSIILICAVFIADAIAIAIFNPQNTTILMNDVGKNDRNSASAIISALKNIGRIMFSLIVVNILNNDTDVESFKNASAIVLTIAIIACGISIAVICKKMLVRSECSPRP